MDSTSDIPPLDSEVTSSGGLQMNISTEFDADNNEVDVVVHFAGYPDELHHSYESNNDDFEDCSNEEVIGMCLQTHRSVERALQEGSWTKWDLEEYLNNDTVEDDEVVEDWGPSDPDVSDSYGENEPVEEFGPAEAEAEDWGGGIGTTDTDEENLFDKIRAAMDYEVETTSREITGTAE